MGHDNRRRHEPARDGIDPDSFFSISTSRRAERKERQLCRQAQEALSFALPAQDDDLLRDLWLVDVEPAPDASRLCVVVQAPRGADPDDVYARLERVSAWLRSEVAQAITRKRAPTLLFRVLPWEEP